jgi:hypothetical protein
MFKTKGYHHVSFKKATFFIQTNPKFNKELEKREGELHPSADGQVRTNLTNFFHRVFGKAAVNIKTSYALRWPPINPLIYIIEKELTDVEGSVVFASGWSIHVCDRFLLTLYKGKEEETETDVLNW